MTVMVLVDNDDDNNDDHDDSKHGSDDNDVRTDVLQSMTNMAAMTPERIILV